MEATVNHSTIVLQVLNLDNYEDWSVRVQTYLLAKDLWAVVEATTEPPNPEHGEAKFKAWKKNDAEALHAIQISCGADSFSFIRDKKTARSAWNTLAAKFNPEYSAGHDNYNDIDFHQYGPLFEAVKNNEWNAAKQFLKQHPNAIRERITYTGKTALHTATIAGHVNMVKELVPLMEDEDLEILDCNGKTALVIATSIGNMEIVGCMVRKNKKIVSIADASNRMPVVLAFRNGHWDLASYLYSHTPLEDLMPAKGPNGATLISQCFYAKKFDIAWDLLQRCPSLAVAKDHYGVPPLYTLAGVPSAFPSGMRLKFWEQWIYDYIYIKPSTVGVQNPESGHGNQKGVIDQPGIQIQHAPSVDINDICIINVQNSENGEGNQRDIIRSVVGLLKGLVWNLRKHLGIKRIYKIKLIHVRSSEFLNRMCEEMMHLDKKQMEDGFVQAAVFRAVERGIPEFVKSACIANRELVRSTNEMRRSIFHYAIECRQEKVYNLIHGLDMKSAITTLTDVSNNNMLHMAAALSPFARLNCIAGAALQMQRELQWFKEVETIVAPKAAELMNWTDYMTPRDLFTKNHKKLLKEGEKWMKETATSFTVVGALIVTIMFSTAFTVPGGYNGVTGFPVFLNKRLFMVFIISDAISLFSATTSSLMFLGILTCRYAEQDFLKSLPTKMVIGLFTLFFSIATMMVAFCAALLLMLEEKPWTSVPIILLSSIPVTLFAVMKVPLLFEILVCTFGVGIFDKNVKDWLKVGHEY